MRDTKLYHTHHQAYTEDIPFWLALARQQNGATLELGCGSGRVLLPLQTAGVQAFGLDIDYGMLALLREQAPTTPIFQADLTNFHLAKKFSLIFLACNTWTNFSPTQRDTALSGIINHLEPGGIFAVSMPNPSILLELEDSEEEEVEDDFPHPDTGDPVMVSNAWNVELLPDGQHKLTFFWHYDHLLPDGQVKRTTNQASHWVSPAETYLEEFQCHGLKTATFGGFDQTPYHIDDAHYFIIIGQKI